MGLRTKNHFYLFNLLGQSLITAEISSGVTNSPVVQAPTASECLGNYVFNKGRLLYIVWRMLC